MPSMSTTEAPAEGKARAFAIALAVTIATSAVMAYAFDPERAGDRRILVAIGGLYAVIAGLAALRLARRSELRLAMRPAIGDISMGALTAGALYGAAKVGQMVLAAPGTPRQAWIMRVYLQIG